MANWRDRYAAGEHAQVWTEMEELGAAIVESRHTKDAAPVVRETMRRARANVDRLFSELLALGYRFQGAPEPAEPDYPLQVRLKHALEYVQLHGGKKFKANPWSHPALAWVDEEEIEVPAKFRNGKPGRGNHIPPGGRLTRALDEFEARPAGTLPLAVRAWFETVGSVNLGGTHPILNRDGAVAVLRVTIADLPALGISAGAGAGFVATVRHAFAWGGFPGWDGRSDAPQRELDWLRSKLLPL